ncbi:Tudor domain-containing protein 1, partial [Araneus ventricosus]
KTLNRMQT